ncbi:hypothetical protein J4421_05810 [Candidatus Woesearchaeota archaeon]|nr:hypothetical protein [Candidatus Woesearchaeota archaeon]
MSTFNALHLLTTAAELYQQQKKSFSRQEIVKKINEIKYLSAQKKIPKLTLRKEIIHLENTLQGIFELEKALTQQKKKESIKITALKDQIAHFQKIVAISKNQDLQKKVDKLYYLLGECMAKADIRKEVAIEKGLLTKKKPLPPKENRARALLYRLDALKKILVIQKTHLKPDQVQRLELQIQNLEQKLRVYQGKLNPFLPEFPITGKRTEEIQHRFILHRPSSLEKATLSLIEKELPLPPPPKKKI